MCVCDCGLGFVFVVVFCCLIGVLLLGVGCVLVFVCCWFGLVGFCWVFIVVCLLGLLLVGWFVDYFVFFLCLCLLFRRSTLLVVGLFGGLFCWLGLALLLFVVGLGLGLVRSVVFYNWGLFMIFGGFEA